MMVNLKQGHSGRVTNPREHRGVRAGSQRGHNRTFAVIGGRKRRSDNFSLLRVPPIIIKDERIAAGIAQFKRRILQCVSKAKRWPDTANEHLLRLRTVDGESTDYYVVSCSGNRAAGNVDQAGIGSDIEVDDLNQAHARRVIFSGYHRGVNAWGKGDHHRTFLVVRWRVSGRFNFRLLRFLPVVVSPNEAAIAITQFEDWIGQLP